MTDVGRQSSAEGSAAQPLAPLLSVAAGRCDGCGACLVACPADAVDLSEGTARIVSGRCVACGACVGACPQSAILVRDDLPRARELLESDRPVIAVLAAEYAAALHPKRAREVEAALVAAGFHAVEHTTLGEELVAGAYEKLHGQRMLHPVLRSTCPVAVSWVLRYHPAATSALAPVVPPYIAQAMLAKTLYPADPAVVYIGPCYARKDEALDLEFRGAVDVALDFRELRRLLEGSAAATVEDMPRRPEARKTQSLSDGFPSAVLKDKDMQPGDLHVARGIPEIEDVLAAMEAGEACPLCADLLACETCLSGPAVGSSMSLFAKRNADAAEKRERQSGALAPHDLLRHLPNVDVVRSFKGYVAYVPPPPTAPAPSPRSATVPQPSAEAEPPRDPASPAQPAGSADVPEAPARTAPASVEDGLYVRPEPSGDPASPRELSEMLLATPEPPDGLPDVIASEASRSRRYGTPLSLVLMRLASAGESPDDEGYTSWSVELLERLLRVMQAELRMTDVVRLRAPNEVAVVLPGIGKTQAWAVAEKLREAVSGRSGLPEAFIAAGISAMGGLVETAEDLERAAERAMLEAFEDGGDSTRLAPNRGE